MSKKKNGVSEKIEQLLSTVVSGATIQQHVSVLYRPEFRAITGSITSAILLQQIAYWWFAMKSRPFSKFNTPCNHKFYRQADSWTEELGFSHAEFQGARKSIATKINKGVSKKKALEILNDKGELQGVEHLVIYWTDSNNVTWYQLNESLFYAYVLKVYTSLGNAEILNYLENHAFCITSSSETTTEINYKDSSSFTAKAANGGTFFEDEVKESEDNTEAPENNSFDLTSNEEVAAQTVDSVFSVTSNTDNHPPAAPRKCAVSHKKENASPDWPEWVRAVLRCFGVEHIFDGSNFSDKRLGIYLAAARDLRRMANAHNEQFSDRKPITYEDIEKMYSTRMAKWDKAIANAVMPQTLVKHWTQYMMNPIETEADKVERRQREFDAYIAEQDRLQALGIKPVVESRY